MALPLQPDLNPWPPWWRRLLIGAALALVILVLGCWSSGRQVPPELLLSGKGHELEYARAAERLILGAQERIWMAMYVIHPDSDGPVTTLLRALADRAQRGLDVRVLLDQDARDDKHVAAAAWLREHGVRVVLDEGNRTSHAKVVVVDGRWILAGSHNWTRSALTGNREASWLVDDRSAATRLEADLAEVPGW
jgi:phosphatidylserine/phosphatidylglycerophosphate/cardiolipin synthase-like enzyme